MRKWGEGRGEQGGVNSGSKYLVGCSVAARTPAPSCSMLARVAGNSRSEQDEASLPFEVLGDQ
jgi:hypothetical protein